MHMHARCDCGGSRVCLATWQSQVSVPCRLYVWAGCQRRNGDDDDDDDDGGGGDDDDTVAVVLLLPGRQQACLACGPARPALTAFCIGSRHPIAVPRAGGVLGATLSCISRARTACPKREQERCVTTAPLQCVRCPQR